MNEYETKLTTEIKMNKNSKKKWEYINKLRKVTKCEETNLYDEANEKIEDEKKLAEKIQSFWTTVYQHDAPTYIQSM